MTAIADFVVEAAKTVEKGELFANNTWEELGGSLNKQG